MRTQPKGRKKIAKPATISGCRNPKGKKSAATAINNPHTLHRQKAPVKMAGGSHHSPDALKLSQDSHSHSHRHRALIDSPPRHRSVEDRVAVHHREIRSLLVDHERLSATHVALKQELSVALQDLRHFSSSAGDVKAEREAQVREVYEKAVKMEDEVRLIDELSAELVQVTGDVHKLSSETKELNEKLDKVQGDLAKERSNGHHVLIKAEIEARHKELQRGRAAVEYEKKVYASNLEQSQAMEEKRLSMAREIEKLQAQLANADKRARAATPGTGFGNHDMGYGGNAFPGPYDGHQVHGGVDLQCDSGPYEPPKTKTKLTGCNYKTFMASQPVEFHGAYDALVVANWIQEMENTFRVCLCVENQKVLYASLMLKGEALRWWGVESATRGEEAIEAMTWEQFTTLMGEKFCVQSQSDQIEEEFMRLKQNSMNVVEYAAKFTGKSQFASFQVLTEDRKVKCFVGGLKAKIRNSIMAFNPRTFQEAVEAASRAETMSKSVEEKRGEFKRKWDGKTTDSKKSKVERWVKHHINKNACFKCGKNGHIARECKTEERTCYVCNKAGHIAPNCRQRVGKGQQSVQIVNQNMKKKQKLGSTKDGSASLLDDA